MSNRHQRRAAMQAHRKRLASGKDLNLVTMRVPLSELGLDLDEAVLANGAESPEVYMAFADFLRRRFDAQHGNAESLPTFSPVFWMIEPTGEPLNSPNAYFFKGSAHPSATEVAYAISVAKARGRANYVLVMTKDSPEDDGTVGVGIRVTCNGFQPVLLFRHAGGVWRTYDGVFSEALGPAGEPPRARLDWVMRPEVSS